jgi:hypothetical protein
MMRLVSSPEASREQLYSTWLDWVGENLGHNTRLAAVAASAATEVAAHGSGFIAAADAARSAWSEAAGGAQPARSTGRPPRTILAAMCLAIGGASVSSAVSLWFVALNSDRIGSLAVGFAIFHLSLLALNVGFLYQMWHGIEWVWRAAYMLVIVGAVFDAVGVFITPLIYVDFAAYFVAMAAPNESPANLVLVWHWIHLIVIQVPILVLLRAVPSRGWFGSGTPTSAHQ